MVSVEHARLARRTHVVLVVENLAPIRRTLCRFLAGRGFVVLDASNAEEAIALIEKTESVDLVFGDMRTSGNSDGYRLAKWILQNRSELPMILETGDLGVGSLAMPYALDRLAEKIRETIVNRSAGDSRKG